MRIQLNNYHFSNTNKNKIKHNYDNKNLQLKSNDNLQGVILELSNKSSLSLSNTDLTKNHNLSKSNIDSIKSCRDELLNKNIINVDDILNNAVNIVEENLGVDLSDDTIESIKKSNIFFNDISEADYIQKLIRQHLFNMNSPEEIIQISKSIMDNLKNVYSESSQEYKKLSNSIKKDTKFLAEKALISGLGGTFIKLEKMPNLEPKKSNSIFDKYEIDVSYKDENIDYSKYNKELLKDTETVINNMIQYFEKNNSFNGFDNNIASKGTNSFKYNQIKNAEAYDEFSSLIDKFYSSESFEDAEKTFEELENLINNEEYSSSINKEKFKLLEEDFKKLKECVK